MPKKKIARTGQRSSGSVDVDIGNRIRAFRMQRDLSQEELGRHLGISFQQVQKYERGVNRLSAGRLLQMCKAIKATPHEILGWDSAAKFDGETFNAESLKLARAFGGLREDLKTSIRHLIDKLIIKGK